MPGFGAIVASCVIGCASPSAPPREERANWATVYQRAELQFDNTVLMKPRVGGNPPFEVQMAPLVLRETRRDPLREMARGFHLSEPGKSTADEREGAVVYFRRGEVTLSGRRHPQIAYYWLNDTTGAAGCVLPVQGIRLTLDAAGAPMIWEVLADCSGVELMFVSRSVEDAARRRFGGALPARMFVSERSVADAPSTVVARVLDDGPVPMGPVLYVRETGDVGTVICRCMPAQAARLSGQRDYKLIELSEVQELELVAERIGLFRPYSAVSYEQWFWPDRIAERLRW